jgi:hypothetical protein
MPQQLTGRMPVPRLLQSHDNLCDKLPIATYMLTHVPVSPVSPKSINIRIYYVVNKLKK